VFGVLPGTIGTLQATEALKVLLGIGQPMIGKLLLYDALAMTFDEVRLKKNPQCKICSPNPEITHLIDYEEFCGVPGHDRGLSGLSAEWEIEPAELQERLAQGEAIRLIDVREPHELQISKLDQAELMPLGSLASHLHELDSAQEIVLMCKSGTRSARALELLAGAGFRKLKNLRGGINEWARQVDSSLPIY
jgi:adenylyltransferase/sulfurtransferase